MTREDVEGTIKCMVNKYSRPRIITKNHVIAGGWGNRLHIRFYEDGFVIKSMDTCHTLDRAYIEYESVNRLIRFMTTLFIDGEDFTMSVDF